MLEELTGHAEKKDQSDPALALKQVDAGHSSFTGLALRTSLCAKAAGQQHERHPFLAAGTALLQVESDPQPPQKPGPSGLSIYLESPSNFREFSQKLF